MAYIIQKCHYRFVCLQLQPIILLPKVFNLFKPFVNTNLREFISQNFKL